MNEMIAIVFLGDFFYDARCINMANSLIDSGYDIMIIDSGGSNNKYRGQKIISISLNQTGLCRY